MHALKQSDVRPDVDKAIATSAPVMLHASTEPSTRYSDQPVSIRARLFGLGGTSAIVLLALAGILLTWRNYTAPQPATLSTFDVAPPAAPPEPASEVPPGPEQVEEKRQPEADSSKVDPPKIELPSPNAASFAVAKPVPDPAPPVEKTTTPENKPEPPAPQLSTGKPTWEGLVLGALDKVKRYPRDAHFARQQGVPYIRFVMNRDGKVLSVRLERSSGHRSLDYEALELPKRAQPLPRPPEDVQGDTIELVVPIEFFMR